MSILIGLLFMFFGIPILLCKLIINLGCRLANRINKKDIKNLQKAGIKVTDVPITVIID